MDGLCSISQSRHCHSVLSDSSGGRGASSPAAYILELQGSRQRRAMPLGVKLGPRSEGTSQAQEESRESTTPVSVPSLFIFCWKSPHGLALPSEVLQLPKVGGA